VVMTSTPSPNPFGARATLTLPSSQETYTYYRLSALADHGIGNLDRLPYTVRILLENLLRYCGRGLVTEEDVLALAQWSPQGNRPGEFPFMPARVLLQDFTGVPAVVDLAAMRSAVARLGGDPQRINPLAPADLVIDHSVQVDMFGSTLAFRTNVEWEYQRNRERYALLRWAQQAFQNFRVVPPGSGIVHQVNLEYLGRVVQTRVIDNEAVAFPDTLVGTDSHTTMINGLGILGWGVGGIEAEAVLLGQPIYLLPPEVVGLRLTGTLREGVTATDLVLTVTQLLRKFGVVDKFVELTGPGVSQLSLPDRATISNMAPEYGATAALWPVDDETLRYLRSTGREEALVELVERYCKEQGLFRTDEAPEPQFSAVVELDLGTVEPSVAGPRRPQDRIALSEVKRVFRAAFPDQFVTQREPAMSDALRRFDWEGGTVNEAVEPSQPTVGVDPQPKQIDVKLNGVHAELSHGSVVIAAITSCTNTSNPSVMFAAGLLAKKAVERGLVVKPHVKTSLAPGSAAVTDYLRAADLLPYLEALRFHVVGYGCTTCIGNSGPLPEPIAEAVRENDLVVAAVLSGNRNFEGRIHPQVRAAFLASPPLVVAYALAGTVDIDLTREPLGKDPNGQPVYLRDIWPTEEEIRQAIDRSLSPEVFRKTYAEIFKGDEHWQTLPVPQGSLYEWDPNSTYVQEPPYFQDMALEPPEPTDITGARVLVMVGDSITTDHISPAGSIPVSSPAGQYLIERGVKPLDFNSYGARRGNHEVMVRGTFGNVRLRNELVPGKEGDWTVHLPDGEVMRIFHAAERYKAEGVPLLVIAGKEYGTGSSRDWAAKGPLLLGVKAVIAESFERIHRSNLVGMGILPLQFLPGESRRSLGLTGRELYSVEGISGGLRPGQRLTVRARAEDGSEKVFQVIARLDSPIDVEYYRHGGILPLVLRRLLQESARA
jgi:aconitate hydratase